MDLNELNFQFILIHFFVYWIGNKMIFKDVFNYECFSCRYYECSFRRNKNIRCKARLKIKNDNYILIGTHKNHEKLIFKLLEIKKEIEESHPHESFWTRPRSGVVKKKDEEIKNIWKEIENNNTFDILLILYKLSKLVGQK